MKFLRSPTFFINSGFVLAVLGFSITAVGFPPTRFGFFAQAESLTAGLWGIGALTALWFFGLSYRYPHLLKNVFKHPLVWGSFLLGGLCIFLSPLHPIPLQTWIGNPQMGEGALSFFALGFLGALYLVLYRVKELKKPLIFAALTTGLIITGMVLVGAAESPFLSMRHWHWAPFFFSACVGFFVPAFVVFFHALVRDTKYRWIYVFLFLPILLGVVYFSRSKTLVYGFILVAPVLLGLHFLIKSKKNCFKLLPWLCLACAIFFIPAVLIGEQFPEIVPPSFVSRSILIRVAFAHYFNDVTFQDLIYFFFGRGWGSYIDFMGSNLYLINNTVLDVANPTIAMEVLGRDEFHSHNTVVEYFISMGVVGFSALLYISYAIIKSLRNSSFYVGAFYFLLIIMLSSSWFQEFASMPHNLFALVILCGSHKNAFKLRFNLRSHFLKYGALGFSGFLIGIAIPYGVISQSTFRHLEVSSPEKVLEVVDQFISPGLKDYEKYMGGRRLVALGISHSTFLTGLFKNKDKWGLKPEVADELNFTPEGVYELQVKLAEYMFQQRHKRGNIFTVIVAINILNNLSTTQETRDVFLDHPEITHDWQRYLEGLLESAPYRFDMAITFLSHLIGIGEEERALQFIRTHILSKNPQDPIGLWFSGVIHLGSEESFVQGMGKLQEALEQGVTNFIPIPREKVLQIKDYRFSRSTLF